MKKIANCDHCGQAIFEGEIVKLCGDGAIVHEKCLKDYAIKQLEPLTMSVEEAVTKE